MWHGHPDLYKNKLEEISNTPDDSDIGYFVEVDLRYPNITKEETKNFPFCPENKVIPKDKFNDYKKKIKPKKYTKAINLYGIGLIRKIIWFVIGCQNFLLDMV